MDISLPDFKQEAANTPYIAYSGIELIEYSDGKCLGRIKIEEHHKNLHKTVHGGSIFSLADTVAGYTAMTNGKIVTTLNASIDYLHPVINTEYLYCEGKIVKDGKNVTVVNTILTDDKGVNVAQATFSCFNVGKRQ